MTLAGGVFPGNSRRPLAATAQAVHPPPSSFSTLSPLAPPFTVDRPLPSSPPLSQLPLSTSSTQIISPSVAGIPYHSRPGSGELVADAYYAGYYPDLPPLAIDDSFKPSPTDYSGAGVVDPWNGPFDEEVGRGNGIDRVSSWVDPPPGYTLQPFKRGDISTGFTSLITKKYWESVYLFPSVTICYRNPNFWSTLDGKLFSFFFR